MEKFSELKKGHSYRDCRKRTGNKLGHWCVPMCHIIYFTVDVSWNVETGPHHTA